MWIQFNTKHIVLQTFAFNTPCSIFYNTSKRTKFKQFTFPIKEQGPEARDLYSKSGLAANPTHNRLAWHAADTP